ncbi:MetS family NSS transporter small subunit [Reichenbachiella carrageenanivorans]
MSASAIFGMILILSIVIGGFVYFLSMAIRNESKKKEDS